MLDTMNRLHLRKETTSSLWRPHKLDGCLGTNILDSRVETMLALDDAKNAIEALAVFGRVAQVLSSGGR